ncbi:MAG: glycolate oxidase subunit GlcE [Gammaproteobacteria bacterium]|nr:glycolate oxidase subunit GlcE [Gammaproteobacteria bacterium]
MSDNTATESIIEQVRSAAAAKTPLVIRAGGSKDFLGRHTQGTQLDISAVRGIVRYEPTELVITARAGTPLSEIEAALAERGQMLAFEPPHFGPTATLGGTLACGLSGPARPFRGSARDFVLGMKIINGAGEHLSFGGEVMKNVAGYDVSRLMCGAYGTLGVLMEISLKVLPLPAVESYLHLELDAESALTDMANWQRDALPVSGLCYDGDRLHVRLSGADQAVAAARRRMGGEPDPRGAQFWEHLREQQSAFFTSAGDLWRVSVPSNTRRIAVQGKQRIDWGGALYWLKTDASAESIFTMAAAAGGHAMRFRGSDRDTVFQPLPAGLLALHKRLKLAFDPHGIFNIGRMYPEM